MDSPVAWDIPNLYDWSQRADFKQPARSVAVQGRCYDAGAANYALYGLMGKLCNRNLPFIFERLKTWKNWAYGVTADLETRGWLKAGYDGSQRQANGTCGPWEYPSTAVPSFTPYSILPSGHPSWASHPDVLNTPWLTTTFDFTWLPLKGRSRRQR